MGIIHKITKLYADFEFLKETGVLSGRDLEFYDSVSVDMGDDVAGIAIQYMCDYLRRYYGKNALVLLDEYDTPLQEAYVNDYWKELADFIRSLFNSTFKTNPYLERGLLTGITRVSKESSAYGNFKDALIVGDLDYMNQFMNQVALQNFSSFDTGNKPSEEQEPERFYHGFVLGLIVDLAEKYRITSNKESGFGRYDVVMEPLKENLDAIVMEFKVQNMTKEKSLEQTVENALRQINEKEYDTELLARGIKKERIRHYGFAFCGKKVLIGTEE